MHENAETVRVALVTGGSGWIGRHYCAALQAAGMTVVAVDLRAPAEQTPWPTVLCDVTSEQDVRETVAAIREQYGTIDILVANAGGAMLPRKPFLGVQIEDFNRVLALNLISPWLLAKHVAPGMIGTGWGRIVMVSSGSVATAAPSGIGPYISAKAGVVGMVRALANELGDTGLTVNCIAPGLVPGGGGKNVHSEQQLLDMQKEIVGSQAIHEPLTPNDLCAGLLYLVSEGAAKVTGQTLAIDGGWTFT
jgi:NAD(P)-dependent dehydrogenase (short-subunit alcohol dehydrogenase family)